MDTFVTGLILLFGQNTVHTAAGNTAADMRVDTRVMFSAGLAAQRLNYLEGCKSVYAIPVSASSKNPFFDRKSPVQTIK